MSIGELLVVFFGAWLFWLAGVPIGGFTLLKLIRWHNAKSAPQPTGWTEGQGLFVGMILSWLALPAIAATLTLFFLDSVELEDFCEKIAKKVP